MITIFITDHRGKSARIRVRFIIGGSKVPSMKKPLPAREAEIALKMLLRPVTSKAVLFQNRIHVVPEKCLPGLLFRRQNRNRPPPENTENCHPAKAAKRGATGLSHQVKRVESFQEREKTTTAGGRVLSLIARFL